MQFGPNHLTGLPDNLSETAARVLQCHDKQSRAAVGICPRKTCRRTEAIVHLGLFSGPKLQTVVLYGIFSAQRTAKPFHAVVFMLEGKPFNQILIDGDGIASQAHLLFDPGTVLFAG
ncbi:MAG: hypothetical protein BWY09_03169 [Candidatus Hydrogenedentes bacterium ADurb.Bin179]|nr:MAG: hypothetical protein BWY09_03169 [Candidatus Hydrogenedentes bacterium ADurb.Bin179]